MKVRTLRFSHSGFTLIELLTVIAVVGILAAGLMTIINPLEQLGKSRDAKRKTDLANIQKALELYYQDHGSYPPSSPDGKIIGPDGTEVEWGEGGFTPYMPALPKDSNASKNYAYLSGMQSYRLFASLDRGGRDPAACDAPKDTACSTASSVSCGGVCNYAVSSPNVSPNR